MTKLALITSGVVVLGAASVVTLTTTRDTARDTTGDTPEWELPAAVSATEVPAYAPKILTEASPADEAVEDRAFMEAARSAWAYVDAGYSPKTGLVVPQTTWAYPTIWDIASGLAAHYSARGLGFISDDEYRRRTALALKTLQQARLYNDVAYGRNYDANTGELVGNDQKPSENGTGYSAIDLGRLLVWLKIIAADDPQLAQAAEAVARRIDARYVIRDGYMHGETLTKEGKLEKFQEGRIGYEQFSATGFNLWGMKANRAAKVSSNGRQVNLQGIPITADKRKLDRVTSEPFIMHGMEIGFDADMQEVAWQTLALQARRYAQTGIMTMASEDALNVKPYYFYYYCVYCSGKEFVINVHRPGTNLDQPRWQSAKAAYAWHALMPSKYTWLAIQAVQPAHQPGKGWATGVFEATKESTGVLSLNTAAVILEAALYNKTGQPFLRR